MERIKQQDSGTYPLSVTTRDLAGALEVPIATVTVTIKDGDGATTVTGTPTIGTNSLSYAAAIAKMPYLDTYTVIWTGMVGAVAREWRTTVEICGGYLFEVTDLRTFDPVFTVSDFPGATVCAARVAAEQRFETASHVAFVPRARRLTAIGDGSARLSLPDNAVRSVRSATLDDTALTADELSALCVREWGALDRTDGNVWTKDKEVTVWYEHGEDVPSAPVTQAAMILASEYLVRSSLSSRATVEQTDVGFFRLSIAGPDRPTGIPEVDQVIRDFGRARPRMA